jgi:4'-phosphopantetheinyl transferase
MSYKDEAAGSLAASSKSGVLIHWLLCTGSQVDSPGTRGWLSDAENRRLVDLRFPKRRTEWLSGRWTAKNLLKTSLPILAGVALSDMTIANESEGAPYVIFEGRRMDVNLSISHRDQRAFCAACTAPGVRIGADIESVESHSRSFVEDYFTHEETVLLERFPSSHRDSLVTLIWSAKEAMLKALGKGLRLDTRRVQVLDIVLLENNASSSQDWRTLKVVAPDLAIHQWEMWWREWQGFILTLALLKLTA